MAKGLNSVNIMGRLVRDPEVRETKTGKSVAGFSIAVDKYPEGSSFFDVTAWDKLATVVQSYVTKGSRVLISGRLDQQTWEKDGQKHSKVMIVALDLVLLDPKTQTDAPTQQARPQPTPDKVVDVDLDAPINLDDIPF